MTIPMNRLVPEAREPESAAEWHYHGHVARSLVQQLHNPRNRSCHCHPDCWCRRTALGRAVKWWFPARYFGVRHKGQDSAEWGPAG
jgi:hypothetical protein